MPKTRTHGRRVNRSDRGGCRAPSKYRDQWDIYTREFAG